MALCADKMGIGNGLFQLGILNLHVGPLLYRITPINGPVRTLTLAVFTALSPCMTLFACCRTNHFTLGILLAVLFFVIKRTTWKDKLLGFSMGELLSCLLVLISVKFLCLTGCFLPPCFK
jgi:hypothetical protein